MTASPQAAGPTAGLGDLLGIRAFRQLIVANVLTGIGFGGSRFAFVWLVGKLTDWNPATAILGIVIGLPPLMLSAWAGALTDRMSPCRLAARSYAGGAVMFGAAGILVVADVMTVPLAIGCAFAAVIAPSMLMPMMQAIVPTVTPPDRLLQAVALQNLSLMMSVMGGIFLSGAIMQLGGTAAGFWLLAASGLLGWLLAARHGLPDRLAGAATVAGSIREGIRISLGTQPLRSLLEITTVFGMAITASTLLLPEFARDVLDQDSLAASALNVALSIGMILSSMLIAARWSPARPGLVLTVYTVLFVGGGLIAIGLTRTYVLTALCCAGWGLAGGIAMTLLRTLTQAKTPPELMGRVMGLSTLAQNGAFPVTALGLFGLVAITDVAGAMVITGAVCTLLLALIAVRPHVRAIATAEPIGLPDDPTGPTG